MSRKPDLTLILLLQAWSEMLVEWGARWAVQLVFWLGFGMAVGGLTTWWVANQLAQVSAR